MSSALRYWLDKSPETVIRGVDQPRAIAARLGLRYWFTSARSCEGGSYGNAVLTRHPFAVRSEGLLPVRRGEVRSVQWLRITTPLGDIDLLNWQAFDRAVDAGYRYAIERLNKSRDLLRL